MSAPVTVTLGGRGHGRTFFAAAVFAMTMGPEAILMVRGGPDEGNAITLRGGMTVIGRAPLNDIVLDDSGVSRQHAAIRGDAEGYWVADLGSRNGTYLNGKVLGSDSVKLKNFDRIELGGVDAAVHYIFMESQATVDMPKPDLS